MGTTKPSSISLPQLTMAARDAHYPPMRTVGHGRRPSTDQQADTRALADELGRAIEGETRFDDGSRAAYSTDASNYRHAPVGVVTPRSAEDVVKAVEICRRYVAPICSRGGGTGLAGQATGAAVILDFSKYMDRVVSIDPGSQTAVVEPGCILDTLRGKAERDHGLTFGPDPATHSRNTLGGMIGNNSCGIHSVMAQFYGHGPMTVHQVQSMDILTYDGVRMTVGMTSDEEFEARKREGGRVGEIYTRLDELRREHESLIRERFPDIPRRVSGYNLDWLLPERGRDLAKALVGSEGTCVVVLSATVRLQHFMPSRALVVLGYPSVFEAGDHCPQVMRHKPTGCEGIDDKLIGFMKKKGMHPRDMDLLPEGKGFLFVEFGADSMEEAEGRAVAFMDDLRGRDNAPDMRLFTGEREKHQLWELRESGLGATAHVQGMPSSHPGWEDASVDPERVGPYLREFRKLLDEFGYDCALYGHFGQGCIHCRIDFDLGTRQGADNYTRFIEQAAHLVVRHGGSLSGEHGDGQSRSALLPIMYGEEMMGVFAEFKAIWDPEHKMNPGKIVAPPRPDQDLREGPGYEPPRLETYFQYPDDHFSFANAVSRCVGVGKCRQDQSGTMCPSYMVTREEEDSTRGRARLLFEMLHGGIINDGWRNGHVREALDLCLACKGCVNECPVNVDMATYKAEYLAHYYKWRLRPIQAYSMGLVYWWARVASRVAPVANFVLHAPVLSRIAKRAGGIAPQREVPRFASPTFKAWFARRDHKPPVDAAPGGRRGVRLDIEHRDTPRFSVDTYESASNPHHDDGKRLNIHAEQRPFETNRVLLWPDTFNNYFMTSAARAGVEVLEWGGCRIELPPRPLCCGRPLYDFGFLGVARKMWLQVIDTLRPWLRDGVPIVGLEPSCVAAFRDELVNLFPNDMDAKRLAHSTFLLCEYMVRQRIAPPRLERRAIVHGHCHHKAVMHMDAEIAVLKAMGIDYELLDSGCCGMAGSFGFSKGKYEVSRRAGERVLLPSVRAVDDDTLIIASGFSCRQQIKQLTDREALHLAEVVRMAIHQDAGVERGAGAVASGPMRHAGG